MEQQKQVARPATIDDLVSAFKSGDFVRVYAVAMDASGEVIELNFDNSSLDLPLPC